MICLLDMGSPHTVLMLQVILSLALSFAVIPLVHFTSTPAKMKGFVNPMWTRILGAIIALVILGLNGYLVITSIINNEFGSATNA